MLGPGREGKKLELTLVELSLQSSCPLPPLLIETERGLPWGEHRRKCHAVHSKPGGIWSRIQGEGRGEFIYNVILKGKVKRASRSAVERYSDGDRRGWYWEWWNCHSVWLFQYIVMPSFAQSGQIKPSFCQPLLV